MPDPEISKRNVRRNYRTTANEEGDLEDTRKIDEQSAPWFSVSRNRAGDTPVDWMFQDLGRRNLENQLKYNEFKQRQEQNQFAQGGPVLPRSGPVSHTTLFKRR